MSNGKIKVEYVTDLAINSLVRLATVVNVLIQYPEKKSESQRIVVWRRSRRLWWEQSRSS
jgi:intergrase/recombinase